MMLGSEQSNKEQLWKVKRGGKLGGREDNDSDVIHKILISASKKGFETAN